MRESILSLFFQGQATALDLANDLSGSRKQISEIETIIQIEDMQERLVVTREMAVALCDAVLHENLPAESLSLIGFALMASDSFEYDGDDVLGDIIADWSAPEINYALNTENVRKFRAWLLDLEEYPTRPAIGKTGSQVISIWRKNSPEH